MFCTKCGSQNDPGARFCTKCGEPLVQATGQQQAAGQVHSGQSGQQPCDQVQPFSQAAASRRGKTAGIAVACVTLLVALVAGGYFFLWPALQGNDSDAQGKLQPIVIKVTAPGWDTDSGASRLPIRVTGADGGNKDFDEVQYVDSHGDGIKIAPGSYELEVAASPIAARGALYEVPDASESIELKEGVDDAGRDFSNTCAIELEEADPATVTDDALDDACDYARKDPSKDAPDADELRDAAEDWRAAAQDSSEDGDNSQAVDNSKTATPSPIQIDITNQADYQALNFQLSNITEVEFDYDREQSEGAVLFNRDAALTDSQQKRLISFLANHFIYNGADAYRTFETLRSGSMYDQGYRWRISMDRMNEETQTLFGRTFSGDELTYDYDPDSTDPIFHDRTLVQDGWFYEGFYRGSANPSQGVAAVTSATDMGNNRYLIEYNVYEPGADGTTVMIADISAATYGKPVDQMVKDVHASSQASRRGSAVMDVSTKNDGTHAFTFYEIRNSASLGI